MCQIVAGISPGRRDVPSRRLVLRYSTGVDAARHTDELSRVAVGGTSESNPMDEDLTELIKCLHPIKRFSSRFDRGTIDLSRPKTEIERFTNDLSLSFDRIDGERLRRVFVGLLQRLPAFDVKEVFGSQPRPHGRRLDLLCNYVDGVERDIPFLTATILGGSFLPTLGFLEHWMTVQARLRVAATTRGEARSESLRSLADFLEVLYREMVTVLYEIECVRQGRQIHRGLDFGNLVETVAAWTRDALPRFVDPEAARIRNAAAHYRWRYDPTTEYLHLHNSNKQGEINWEARFSLRELYARLRGLFFDVGHLGVALLWRTSNSCLEMLREPPLSHLFEPGVIAAPPPELEAKNRQAIALRFQPVQSHLVTSRWTSRREEREAALSQPSVSEQ